MLRAVLVTPLSGPLARFGAAGADALELWAREFEPDGPVELSVHDAHPDTAEAMRVALATRPHLVFGPYGSGPVRAAARSTGRLVWNHGGASLAASWEESPNVVNVLSPADTYLEGAMETVRDASSSTTTVVIAHVDTGFGRAVAGGAEARAVELGFSVARRSFPPGRATDDVDDLGPAEVLCVAAGFADELALARALLGRSWRAAIFVGAGEEGVLDDLGAERDGLVGPTQWLASAAPDPEVGPTAELFTERFRARTGRDPSYPAAQAFAAGVLAGHAIRTGGSTDDDALRDVVTELDVTTLFGRFRVDPVSGRQVGHRVLTVQWQDGDRRVVWPSDRADADLRLPER